MKTNDITIASFPKAGVTYLGYLLTTARAYHNKLSIRPTFFNIDWLLIDSGQMKDIPRADIWHDGMGDFVKEHGDRSAGHHNVVYLLRNPFDTLKSYYHFLTQWNGKPPGTPQQFLDGREGISKWVRHLQSWVLGQNPAQPIYVVQYEKLVADPRGEIASIFFNLGFPLWYQSDAYETAIAWASLDHMRVLEENFSIHNPGYQRFNMQFVRPGYKRELDQFEPLRGYVEQQTAKAYEEVKSRLPCGALV